MRLQQQRVFLVATMGALGLVFTDCKERYCTSAGCPDPLRIEIAAATWPAGAYTFEFTEAGREYSCALELPAAGGGAGGAAGANSGAGAGAGAGAGGEAGAATSTDNPQGSVPCEQTAGAATDPWEAPSMWFYSTVTLQLKSAPEEVPLRISYQGRQVFDEQLTPSYRASYPNGRDCGACRSANESISLENLDD